jgi:hypothetical protein
LSYHHKRSAVGISQQTGESVAASASKSMMGTSNMGSSKGCNCTLNIDDGATPFQTCTNTNLGPCKVCPKLLNCTDGHVHCKYIGSNNWTITEIHYKNGSTTKSGCQYGNCPQPGSAAEACPGVTFYYPPGSGPGS